MKIRKIILSALTGLLLTSSALAQAPQPPERFRHYRGPVVIKMLSQEQIGRVCPHIPGIIVRACTYKGNPCRIYVSTTSWASTASIISHEKGHCAGWSANHEM